MIVRVTSKKKIKNIFEEKNDSSSKLRIKKYLRRKNMIVRVTSKKKIKKYFRRKNMIV